MTANLYCDAPMTVTTLDVPVNGGHCVICDASGELSIMLNGYGREAAANARAFAAELLKAAEFIESQPVVELPPAPVVEEAEVFF